MKFGKSLSNQIEETLPEWRDKFLSYKDLKRRLKLIAAGDKPAKRPKVAEDGSRAATLVTREEEDFVSLLEAELDKFNAFFVEKEEEYIIRQKLLEIVVRVTESYLHQYVTSQDLQDRVAEALSKDYDEQLMKVRKEIVDFHGEIVLLENYSALNYTGISS
ncbi:hypothetical protein GW17_00012719 [Ensete ventricosum]|nr:hypothetical protein GW17_00012719 [Ensete ventricosum]